MSKKKLSVEDFHSQFHNVHHHNDPGEYVKPKHHLKNPTAAAKHKGLDLRALRNSKRKKSVVVAKDPGAMKYEMAMRKKAK